MRTFLNALVVLALACNCATARAQSAADQLAVVVDALMLPAGSDGTYGDWTGLEAVKQIRWQPLPPTMLDEALPDGSYFTRKGLANLAGQPFGVVATGARTMVVNVYFRNVGAAPMGETAALDALRRHGFSLEIARCPVKGAAGAGNTWWHIKGPKKDPAWFNSQVDCNGKKCEGYALLLGQSLPTLTPQQQHLYTDRCTGTATGTATATVAAWDAQLAMLFTRLMPAAPATSVPWTDIDKAQMVTWAAMPPLEMQSPPWSDTGDHFYRGGQTDLGGRVMYLTATGDRNAVRTIRIEDQATQANRGDVLTALQRSGFKVELVRCGKIYQLSSGKWYRVSGQGKHPAILRREVGCDTIACPKGHESYALALDGVLPKLQAGEVDAVAGTCPGR
jgi:hypothetical protein